MLLLRVLEFSNDLLRRITAVSLHERVCDVNESSSHPAIIAA